MKQYRDMKDQNHGSCCGFFIMKSTRPSSPVAYRQQPILKELLRSPYKSALIEFPLLLEISTIKFRLRSLGFP